MFTEKKLAFVAIIIGWSLFIPQQVSAASPCPIGFQLSPTAPDIDGDLGTQWTDAYVLDSDTSPCLADLSDTGGARDLTIYSKRYARGAQNFIGLFFQVIDSTFCSDPSGCLGEHIILQLDPNFSGGTGLENGASAIQKDYKIKIVHKWQAKAGTTDILDVVSDEADPADPFAPEVPTVFDASSPTICSGTATHWAEITTLAASDKPKVKIKRTAAPQGYNVEVEVPLSMMGNPGSDIGVALDVVNDVTTCSGAVCDGYGSEFPESLGPTTNADNPIYDCGPSWTTPDDWATGFFDRAPDDVWISRSPAYWKSEDVDAKRCGVIDNSYYPAAPCRMTVWSRVRNSSTSDQTRHILFIRGEHGAGPVDWRFVDIMENQTVAASTDVTLDSDEAPATVLTGLIGHPCVRTYILPPSYRQDFDKTRIMNIANHTDLTEMVTKYGIEDQHWAQQNISRKADTSACPDPGCLISGIMERTLLAALDTDQLPAATPVPRADGLLLAQANAKAAEGLNTGREPCWFCGDEDRLPPIVEEPGDNVELSQAKEDQYGSDHVMLQVVAYGTRPASSTIPKPHFNFLEEIGGVVELVPAAMFGQDNLIPVSFKVSNPADVTRRIHLSVDLRLPDDMRGVQVALDTSAQDYQPGETRTFTAYVGKGFSANPWSLSFHLGATSPTGNFSNNLDGSGSIGIDAEYMFNNLWAGEIYLGFDQFSGKSGAPDVDVTSLVVNGKRYFYPGRRREFAVLGAGAYSLDPGDTEFGINAGIGSQYNINRQFAVEAVLKYHSVATSGSSSNYFTAHAGLRYRLP